MSLVKIA